MTLKNAKKRKCVLWIVVFMILMMSVLGCGSSDPRKHEKPRILIVHSYHLEYPWTHAIDDGIMSVLGTKGYTIQKVFMDTKRNTEESFKIAAGKKALAIVKKFKPDIVLATDDNAQEYCAQFLVNKTNLSIVFCGLNEEISKYHYPGNNATGVTEQPLIRSSLDFLKKLALNIRSFTILTDKGNTSEGFVAYFKKQKLPVQIDQIVITESFDHWKDVVKKLRSDALIIYTYHTIHDKGKYVEPTTVMEWTTQHLKKPSVGFFDFSIAGGVLLGDVESGFEHGQLAGQRAIEILDGKKTTELPVVEACRGMFLINAKTAAKLGIDISSLRNIADKIYE